MSGQAAFEGQILVTNDGGISTVEFSHPKGNSLPSALLRALTDTIQTTSSNPTVKVLLLKSSGESAFCAGASFAELKAIESLASATKFFTGFADLMLALIRAPQPIVVRVHGKVVGGGVGLVAAADYAIAVSGADVRLSELSLGIGPFTIGPVVQHKIGHSSFSELSLSAGWRDADWCRQKGLYQEVCSTSTELDEMARHLCNQLAGYSPRAVSQFKQSVWSETQHWKHCSWIVRVSAPSS